MLIIYEFQLCTYCLHCEECFVYSVIHEVRKFTKLPECITVVLIAACKHPSPRYLTMANKLIQLLLDYAGRIENEH